MTKNRKTSAPKTKVADPALGMSGAVDQAYQWLRDAIMAGRLRSGELLLEKELGEEIGVSRTPVREALRQLEKEGLVVLERYRKNFVAHFGERDVVEIFEIRSVLESLAAGRAAIYMNDEQMARLLEVQRQIEDVIEKKGAKAAREFDELNSEFHSLIWQAAGSKRIAALLNNSLAIPFNALDRFRENMTSNLQRACAYHREIIAALKAKHPERAATQMRAHILSVTSTDV